MASKKKLIQQIGYFQIFEEDGISQTHIKERGSDKVYSILNVDGSPRKITHAEILLLVKKIWGNDIGTSHFNDNIVKLHNVINELEDKHNEIPNR